MLERYNAKHTPIPRHKPSEEVYKPGVIPYTLNDAEKEFLRAGRLDLIPWAEQRGLVAPPVETRPVKPKPLLSVDRKQKEIVKAITAEMLIAHMDAGLTNQEIGNQYGVSSGTVTWLLKKFGIAGKPGRPRQHRHGPKNYQKRGERK